MRLPVFAAGSRGAGREPIAMHNPERDPFFEGLCADIQEGIDEANRGDLLDGEDVFRELLGEESGENGAE